MNAVGDGYSQHALRSARKRAGLSQAHLARMIGVAQTAVSAWERGISHPQSDNLRCLASVLLRPDWLPEDGADIPASLPAPTPPVAPLREMLRQWRARREDALRPARRGASEAGRRGEAAAAAWWTAIREVEGWLKEVSP